MPNVKIISVGNGAMHAVNYMIDSGLTSAEFISCSTRRFYLQKSNAEKKIWLGKEMVQYLDSSTPSRSEHAAIESREEILSALRGANAIILVACLGGCDGTGASPIIAEYARELGALTVAVITRPYTFEGSIRIARVEVALKNLSEHADAVIKIRDDKILQTIDPKTSMTMAFKCLDEILCHAVRTLIAVCQGAFKIDVDKTKILGVNAQQLLND